MKSGLITETPFLDMASEIKLPKNQRGEDNEISPFNREERDLIIEAFAKHPHYRYTQPMSSFAFLQVADLVRRSDCNGNILILITVLLSLDRLLYLAKAISLQSKMD